MIKDIKLNGLNKKRVSTDGLNVRLIKLREPISLQLNKVEEVKRPILYPFQNRRVNEVYLKNVYPSGFNIGMHRSNDTPNQSESQYFNVPKMIGSYNKIKSPILSRSNNASESFIAWTKGEQSSPKSDSIENKDDCFADVAGPYFKDNRLDKEGYSTEAIAYVSNIEMPLNFSRKPKETVSLFFYYIVI